VSRQIINIENVYYSYPKEICSRERKYSLEGINLSVLEGEFFAVMGETGAGKSAFCRLLNGIIPHFYGGNLSGTVTVDGERTDESSVARLALKVGMALDDPEAQLFTSSVLNEAAFGPENLLLPVKEIEERVKYALHAVGLEGFEDRQPMTLSGGEKQRLAIAAALAMNAEILVLDEPLCRLDSEGGAQVMSVLGELRDKYKKTVIMTAHDSKKMLEYADRVCILKKGQIVCCGEAKSILSNRTLLEENGIQPPDEADIYSVFTERTDDYNKTETNIPAIEIKNSSFFYTPEYPVAEKINLTIADNDFAALIGYNGCGKTTVLKGITGLLSPSTGNIFIRGKNTRELSVSGISKEAGFVMQNPDNQLFTGSVYDEVAFALRNTGFSKNEIKQHAENALNMVGLKDMTLFPHALSKADRARLVFACVIAMGCRIIILDEVDVGQDYAGSLKIMDIASELHSKGYTIIFVTHNMSLVCKYAHRLIIMDKKGIITDVKRKK
jgi:energy-coupling factor transport system ATP-binding protein